MDDILGVLNRPAFAGFTVLHVLLALAALAALGSIMGWLKRRKPTQNQLMRAASCGKCGWRGQISTHNRKCPKCSAEIGNLSRPA